MRQLSNNPRGFTVIELLIVVAIIALLAAVAIPSWVSTSRNKKYDPEIAAMFAELSTREEQYKSEQGNGAYLTSAACPAAPVPAGADFNVNCVTTGSTWATLRVVATDSAIRCTYAVTAGAAGTTATPPAGFTMTSPAGSWYYVVATCDMDGNGGANATFFVSSTNTAIQKQNYGS